MQPDPTRVMAAVRNLQTREAWHLIRRQLRYHSSKLRHQHDERYVPGHSAMALGRALERFASADPRTMRAIVRLAHLAMKTLPCQTHKAPQKRTKGKP